jgi:hypothetical protein
MAQFTFNAAQYEPATGLPLWIDGWHPVVLTSIEPKENNTPDPATGQKTGRLECTIQAIDGPHKGQTQRFGLNLWHSSAQTVEIANRFMSALIYVTIGFHQNRLTINQDTQELCNIPFLIQASRQKDNPNMNDFRAVKDIQGGDPKTGAGRGTIQIVQAPPTPAGGAGPSFQTPPGGPQFAPPPAAGGPAPVQQPGFGAPQQQPAFAAPPAGGPAPAPAAGGWAPPNGAPAGAPPAGGWAPPQAGGFAPPAGGGAAPSWATR